MRIFWHKICISLVLLAFLANGTLLPAHAQQALHLPQPGMRLELSQPFAPPLLKGLKVYPNDPLRLDFILDKGDDNWVETRHASSLHNDTNRLIKYFLAAVTVPEKDLWVNLSPYEKDRIVPEAFGETEMGRDLLAQDYILKQITASLLYPESDLGKEFWARVYSQAQEKYGTTDIPVDTFNKVWIVPEKATVYETRNSAYVVESRLKVMLETDYVAQSEIDKASLPLVGRDQGRGDIAKDIIRSVILPILEKEINEGKNFAQLRQVYSSLILATWYKDKIKDTLMSQAYADKAKTAGVDIADKAEKEKIWAQYVEAFKKGVYNYIKEEQDPLTREPVVHKYISGGMDFAQEIRKAYKVTVDASTISDDAENDAVIVETDVAMLDIEDTVVSKQVHEARHELRGQANGFDFSWELFVDGFPGSSDPQFAIIGDGIKGVMDRVSDPGFFLNDPQRDHDELRSLVKNIDVLVQQLRAKYPQINNNEDFELYVSIQKRILAVLSAGILSEGYFDALDMAPVDLNALLHASLTRMDAYEYFESYDPGISNVKMDGVKFQHVISNLLINAQKAVDARKEAADKGRITIETRKDGDHVVITVSNNGPEIAPENITRIFEHGFTTRAEKGGTGFGLDISRRVVEGHGGTIVAENMTDAQGVRFIIRLPVADHAMAGGAALKDYYSQQKQELERSFAANNKEALKHFYDAVFNELKTRVLDGQISSRDICAIWSDAVETVLKKSAGYLNVDPDRFVVMSLGSLARGEMALNSDADFMVFPKAASDKGDAQVEYKKIFDLLKEFGLTIDGHINDMHLFLPPEELEGFLNTDKVEVDYLEGMPIGQRKVSRTIEQELFMDAKFVFGNSMVGENILASIKSIMNSDGFGAMQIKSMPHVKRIYSRDALDGMDFKHNFLRPMNYFIWAQRVKYRISERNAYKVLEILEQQGALAPEEARQIKAAFDFGFRIRNIMSVPSPDIYIGKDRENDLSRAVQEDIAKKLQLSSVKELQTEILYWTHEMDKIYEVHFGDGKMDFVGKSIPVVRPGEELDVPQEALEAIATRYAAQDESSWSFRMKSLLVQWAILGSRSKKVKGESNMEFFQRPRSAVLFPNGMNKPVIEDPHDRSTELLQQIYLVAEEEKDFAMVNKGGIDLTREKLPLKVKNSGETVQFDLDPAMFQRLQQAAGLTPVVVSIQPMTSSILEFLNH